MINHSCWIIGSTILCVKEMDKQLIDDMIAKSPETALNFKENLKKVVDLTCEIIEWNSDLNGLL